MRRNEGGKRERGDCVDKVCPQCREVFKTNRKARIYCHYPCSNKANADKRMEGKTATVWSCGGGVQSTAIAALICAGKLPKPDYSIITDVGYEKSATFEYVKGHMIPRLTEAGVLLNIVRTTDYADNTIMDAEGYVRIPAFQRLNEKDSAKFQTHCSGRWKAAVARKWMREQGITKAINWIGISLDEAHRARPSTLQWVDLRYPLIDMGIRREDCLWLIAQHGWPRPPRTSCYICPLQEDGSWLRTRQQYPEDWSRAVAIEQQIQSLNPNVYLHRSCVPLPEVRFKFEWADAMSECKTPGVQCWG
jgi:hypothetical protein